MSIVEDHWPSGLAWGCPETMTPTISVIPHLHTCRRFPGHRGDHHCPVCGGRWLVTS